jgi:hypothetical protein
MLPLLPKPRRRAQRRSRAQARRLLSVLKVITRREGGGRLWKSRTDFQGAVGAFSASMAPAPQQRRQLKKTLFHQRLLFLARWAGLLAASWQEWNPHAQRSI